MSDMELALLGHATFAKRHWSAEDIQALRECWDEYQKRSEEMIALFSPAYSDVLAFHEIDCGTVGLDDVRSLERAGAGIAAHYRVIMRKLRAVERTQAQSQDHAASEPVSR